MNRNFPFPKIIIVLIIIMLMMEFTALAVEVTPIPGFVGEAKKNISENKLPGLPDSLNGTSLKDLKGYKEISGVLETGGDLKSEVIAYLLIYEDIRKKLEQCNDYMKNASGSADPDRVFGGKFIPIDAEKLVEKCPYSLSDKEKEMLPEKIKHHLKLLNVSNFESFIVEDKTVELKSAAVFYSNAVKKTEIKLERTFMKLQEFTESSKDEIKKFIRKNIKIEFRIGDSETYSSIKKNFKENDPIIIGFKYWTEKADGEIPLEWKIVSPNKGVKMGKTTIIGGREGEYVSLVRGKIPVKAVSGIYEVQLTLFPGEGDYLFREDYKIGGVPAKITGAFVLDKNKKASDIFKPGDKIFLVIMYEPYTQNEKASFTWSVFDPSGNRVKNLSLSKSLKLRKNNKKTQQKYIKSKIPAGAKAGTYKFQAQLQFGEDKITSNIVEFIVASKFFTKIIPNKRKFKIGEKAVFNSRIIGGTRPYSTRWKIDSGVTSTHKNIAIIFYKRGRRWITLTVTDSSRPAITKSAKIYVDVK